MKIRHKYSRNGLKKPPNPNHETLDRMKRWPSLLRKWLDIGVSVHIWSEEHEAYWRKAAAGYTTNEMEAGRFSMLEAHHLTVHCGPEKKIQFRRALGLSYHAENGERFGYPPCCINFFCANATERHWWTKFYHPYQVRLFRNTGFVPCPKHVALLEAGHDLASFIKDRKHPTPFTRIGT